MNPQFQLMVMMAATSDIKDLANNIKDAADEVAIFGNNEEKVNLLRMHCTMFIMHLNSNGTLDGAMELIKEIDSQKQKLSVFDIDNLS